MIFLWWSNLEFSNKKDGPSSFDLFFLTFMTFPLVFLSFIFHFYLLAKYSFFPLCFLPSILRSSLMYFHPPFLRPPRSITQV